MTGGHAGLGLVGAKTLVSRYGCSLILAGRSPERLEQGAKELRAETGARVEVLAMNLSSLASVRSGAARCKDKLKSGSLNDAELQSIICNAGVQSLGPVSYSADGYEETFASNCLGHFLMVNLLLDSVATRGRVVWTASGTHDPARMDGRVVGVAAQPDANTLAQQGRDGKPISAGRRYATSKLCTILYAYELDRRLRRAGTAKVSIAYDPGFIPEIGMGKQAPAIFRSAAVKFLLRKLGMTMGQMPLSGEALGMLAAAAEFAEMSGKYFHSNNCVLKEARSSNASYDERQANKLWSDSKKLVQLEPAERPKCLSSIENVSR
jgi:NAD(P)-dependent dehydrogenase (short-subunit alcohol dehydrogenase family)